MIPDQQKLCSRNLKPVVAHYLPVCRVATVILVMISMVSEARGGSLFRQPLGQAKFFVIVNCKNSDMAQYSEAMLKKALRRSGGFSSLDPQTVRALKSDEILMAKLNDADPATLKEISRKYAVDYVMNGTLAVGNRLLASQYEGTAMLSVKVVRNVDAVDMGAAVSYQVGGVKNPGPRRELALPAMQCAVTRVTNDIIGKLSLPGGFEPDGVIRLDLTGEREYALDDSGTSIAISGDNQCYVGTSRHIICFDLSSGAQHTLRCNSGISALAVWPDNSVLISGHQNGYLRAWNPRSRQQIWATRAFNTAVTSLAILPEGSRIAAGSASGELKLFDKRSSIPTKTWQGHKNKPVHSLGFTYDGKYLLSAGADRYVRKWDLDTTRMVFSFREIANANNRDRGNLLAAEFTREGNIVAVAMKDIEINLRSKYRVDREFLCLRDCERVPPTEEYRFEAHDAAIEALVIYPTSCRFLASGSRDGKVKIWDMQLRQGVFENFVGGWVTDMAFSPEGNFFGVVTRKGKGLFNRKKKQVLKVWRIE